MSTTQTDFLRYLRTLTARQATGLLSDQQLLERFLHDRSEASFAALVARHGPMVLSVCRRVLQHTQDAEDAFQATFLVLTRKAGSIRKQASLGSWLHGVAYHSAECLKAKMRRRTAHERRLHAPPPREAMDDISWRELRSVLDEELQRLPERYRAPLVLCYLEARTQDEAARQLGWSKNTFRRRLESGRNALGRRLARRGITLSAALTGPLLADTSTQAALPPLLAANTVRAGLASATGNMVSGMVSEQAAALAESSAGSLLAKKSSIAVVLLLSLTLGVGSLLTPRPIPGGSRAGEPATPPAHSANKDQALEIKGRVLDPDGKPFSGAKVYVSTYTYKDKSDPKVRAQTDTEGCFHFMADRKEMDEQEMVTAVAPGCGPDWVSLKEVRNGKELTLRLVKDDVPIQGRVLDLEGRPVAGTAIRLERLRKMPDEDLTPWLKALQAKPTDGNAVGEVQVRYERILSSLSGVLGMPKFVKTGADGRFEFRGFGRERVVQLHIEGPGIEYRTVTAMTRPGLAKGLPLHMHGATFDHLAAPSKPIRGTVREKGSDKPVAGAQVYCQPAAGEGGESAITDKDGHYEISGIRKSEHYFLSVSGPPIIGHFKEANDTPGLQPVTVNFEVERGLVLRVRVREKDAGKPVRGLVQYAVGDDNRNLDRYTTFPRNAVGWGPNEKDGTSDHVVLPGPGYIAFRATQESYARSRIKGKENESFLGGTIPQPLSVGTFHAIVPINPRADDPQSLICDIVLDRGQSLKGTVTDPEGRPLSGALAWGMNAVMSLSVTHEEDAHLATPSFTATGLDSRYPRMLIFHHREKKLAQALLVRGDEKKPLTVRLQTLGVLTGRVVDAAGKPLVGIAVSLGIEEKQLPTLPEDRIFGNSSLNAVLFNNRATTDKDGRFRIEGLVTGLKYDLNLGGGEKMIRGVRKDLASKPGTTVDVGEIKVRASSR